MKNYDKSLKPAKSSVIKFALNLNQIVAFIEKDQVLVLNVFLDHEWKDERLKWEPKKYENITLLRIESSFLWWLVNKIY